ncbi:hypothetical protein RHS04_08223 [Rhizoctonia solani]|uniref:Uncharacterized protein n=1 Tax=Rhizoctonia solani TaxID=456999 RepID=A0A8H7H3K4_9AGAM|nr:hypothetical protein RHS04_08223 [Rhizoctonia solani]
MMPPLLTSPWPQGLCIEGADAMNAAGESCGTKPACDRCVRSNTACVYDPVEKSKVALLRDEVVMLRQKVKTLEAMISSAPKSSSPPLSTSVPAKRRSPSDDIPPRPHPPPPPRTQKRSISLSSEDQIKLLNQFSQVQHVAYEYTNVPPNRGFLSPSHPAGEPYAAKTSAFLLASHFSPNPALRSLSTDLLECTRDCIDEAIRTADFSPRSLTLARPMPSAALVLDAIHASTLLASWLLVQGRCVECQQTLFSAAKLAILSGIHKIRSLDSTGRTPSPISPKHPPSSHSGQRSPISDERYKPSSADGRLSPSHLQPLGSSTQRSVTPATQNFEASAEGPIKTMIPRPVGIADTKNRVGILWQLLCLGELIMIVLGHEAGYHTAAKDKRRIYKTGQVLGCLGPSPMGEGCRLKWAGAAWNGDSGAKERGCAEFLSLLYGRPGYDGTTSDVGGAGEVGAHLGRWLDPRDDYPERTEEIRRGRMLNVSLPWEDCPSEVRVETIWPDFDSNETTCTSIASLFHASRKASPSPSLAPTGSTRAGSPPSSVDPYALRAKSVVLLERAVRLSAQSERGSRPSSPRSPNQASSGHPVVGDATRAAIKETDTAISNVLEQLPTERSIAALHPHTLLLCARVRLHETLMSQEHVSQVVWVQSAVAIVRLLDGMRMDDVVRGADLLLAYAWMASYMVLLHERYYVPYHPESEHVARIKSDLDKLKALLDTVGVRMPVIATLFKTSVDQFNALRDRKSASPFATPPPSDNGEVKTEDEHDELVDDD